MTRVLYTDVDGTLVGPRGCFFRAEGGAPSLEPARALVELLAAGWTLVLVSGRTSAQLLDAARVFGADGYIAEMGSVIGWDAGRRREVLHGAMPAHPGSTPAAVVEGAGLVADLLAAFAGRLEYHSPWHAGHEADVMLRGRVDPAAVERWTAARGFGWLRLHDNGVLPPPPPGASSTLDPAGQPAHVYHLMPAGLSKGAAVARDLARRGLTRRDAVAVGDSASDLSMAAHVDRMFLTANGARNPHLAALLPAHSNVTATSLPLGLGWAEAVRAVLDGEPVGRTRADGPNGRDSRPPP